MSLIRMFTDWKKIILFAGFHLQTLRLLINAVGANRELEHEQERARNSRQNDNLNMNNQRCDNQNWIKVILSEFNGDKNENDSQSEYNTRKYY